MTREEQIKQQAQIIAEKITTKYANNTQSAIEYKRNVDALIEMAQWADEQSNKWHKIAEGDLPEEGGNYWCKLKGKYDQGSSHYKQHCNNGYCILQWLPKKKAWNVRYNTEVEAWIELPKYNEE